MVNYNCIKCNKVFKQKGHLIYHINKKRPCKEEINVNNITINGLDDVLAPTVHIDALSYGANISYNNDDEEDNNVNIKNKIMIDKEHKCIICNSEFTRASSLKRHLLKNCKKINDDKKENKDEQTQTILMLQEKINNLTQYVMTLKDDKTTIKNLTNNNAPIDNSNTTNVNNGINNNINKQVNNVTNIKIEFGKEDLDKISNDFFIKTLVNFSGAAIPSKIIEGIHFNPEFKEFMNVFITDISRNKAMVFDGKTWNIANADEVVDTLFDRAIIFCENRNEELYDKIQKNDKINKKINKEMHIMDIMSNNEPYDYNDYKQPIDINGRVLNSNELIRGKNLNAKAKEHLKNNLYNKKTTIKK
jgi:hypothetical protein